MGDRKGFANSQKALEKYFLTAGEMSKIITEVFETFKIDVEKKKRDQHYEIFGSENEITSSDVEKITPFLKRMVQLPIKIKMLKVFLIQKQLVRLNKFTVLILKKRTPELF